jgi:transposase
MSVPQLCMLSRQYLTTHRIQAKFPIRHGHELNPIERVWKLTGRRCLHNRYFSHLEEVIVAIEKEFTNGLAAMKPSVDYAQLLKSSRLVRSRPVTAVDDQDADWRLTSN